MGQRRVGEEWGTLTQPALVHVSTHCPVASFTQQDPIGAGTAERVQEMWDVASLYEEQENRLGSWFTY
jgi:hypothetical protein